MIKLGDKYSIVIILAISLTAVLMGYVKTEAQWEAEWQKTLEAGKKEGKISVYAAQLAPSVRKQAPVFTKKFGIEVEVTATRGPEMPKKLRTEKSAGVNIADVVINGSNSMFA
ncbi:MAG: hypothetical protein Q8P24_13750, partial [Desulfobacterales bacterium]|nr:hypothetical protein [Desulfobacterales bacterium]